LRRREHAIRAELQSIADQTTDRAAYLRLAETLTAFLARLRSSAKTLDIIERQRVVRLLVKEILVGDDRIVIRHAIPPTAPSGGPRASPSGGSPSPVPGNSYLLRSGSHDTPLRRAFVASEDLPVCGLHWRFQPAFHVEHRRLRRGHNRVGRRHHKRW
jgi:site-specific DNA recombinase